MDNEEIKIPIIYLYNFPMEFGPLRYAMEGDSGIDLRVATFKPLEIPAKYSISVPTGIKIEIPVGFEIQVRPRSGLSLKFITPILGTIDSGYRGELKIILRNSGLENYMAERGEKIAQIVLSRVEKICFVPTLSLTPSSRGEDGFGSTGKV